MIKKKDETDAKKYLRETPEEDQAFGWVTEGKLLFPGSYRFMPLIAWIVDPPREAPTLTRKLLISGALLKMVEGVFAGMLDWSLPITERLEPTILDVLATFGWDHRVWPDDAGWPEGTDEEEGMLGLMAKRKLDATMTFPPGPEGNRVMTVHVLKISSPFPLPPVFVETDRIPAPSELRDRFRTLTAATFRP